MDEIISFEYEIGLDQRAQVDELKEALGLETDEDLARIALDMFLTEHIGKPARFA